METYKNTSILLNDCDKNVNNNDSNDISTNEFNNYFSKTPVLTKQKLP